MVISKDDSKWKKSLRDKWIIAMTGNQHQKYFAYRKTDKYYANFAPRVLYKYYGSNLERFKTTIKVNKIWCSAPCNFNDVFDCDISIDKKKMFENELQKMKTGIFAKVVVNGNNWRTMFVIPSKHCKTILKPFSRKLEFHHLFQNLTAFPPQPTGDS